MEWFNNFNPGNDPRSEHDFETIEHNGMKIFWKIDCHDPAMQGGSPDPSDPGQTARALTIMLAEEY